jgi:hypothetical protein
MQNVISILEKHSAFKMDLDDFLQQFNSTHNNNSTPPLNTEIIQGRLCDMLILSEKDDIKGSRTVTLAPMRIFARELTQLLEDFGGSLMLGNVDAVYMQKYGRPLRPAQMGYPSLLALLQAIPEDVEVRGKHRAKRVCLTGTESSTSEESLSSFEETHRSSSNYKGSSSRHHNDSSFNSSYSRNNNNNNNSRCYSSDQYNNRHYNNNNHLKIDFPSSGRLLSDSPNNNNNKMIRNTNNGSRPPPLSYTPLPMPPSLYPSSRGVPSEPTIFTFDRAAPLSPPVSHKRFLYIKLFQN